MSEIDAEGLGVLLAIIVSIPLTALLLGLSVNIFVWAAGF